MAVQKSDPWDRGHRPKRFEFDPRCDTLVQLIRGSGLTYTHVSSPPPRPDVAHAAIERARAEGQPKQDPPTSSGAPPAATLHSPRPGGRAGAVGEAAGALVLAEMNAGGAGVAALGRQLIDAAMRGTIEHVGALLDQGVLVDSRDGRQNTPLIWASRQGYRAVASLLCDRGGCQCRE